MVKKLILIIIFVMVVISCSNSNEKLLKEALEKASQIVHYSNDKIDKDGLMGLLPSFLGGDTTYYKYWNNIRENLIKKIEKKFN